MAHIALQSRTQVSLRLGGGSIAGTVTAIALTGRTRIMEPATTDKSCGSMTVVTIQRCCDMRRIGLGILANSRTTIMAGLAIVHDAAVIKRCPGEGSSVMTDTTILVR